ncbi:hypothetical protein A2U01_0081273, partial [Trifolium medium]|nr:hypothetical protein [Trifolium medium]
ARHLLTTGRRQISLRPNAVAVKNKNKKRTKKAAML